MKLLRQTFCHIEGVGESIEKNRWKSSIISLEDLHDNAHLFFKGNKIDVIKKSARGSLRALEKGDRKFFFDKLPKNLKWRIVPQHCERVAYLDIETTGLSFPPRNCSTSISVVINGKLHQAHSKSQKKSLLAKVANESDLLVTYYGSCFDLPFLKSEFDFDPQIPHIDLCFWLRRHKLVGGLKKICQKTKEVPKRKTIGLDGFGAVTLWQEHLKGNSKALPTLLTYNAEDTTCLPILLKKAFQLETKSIKHLPFYDLNIGKIPKITTKADLPLIRSLF
ncbi:ribonuclease H-like domain-containing protein [Bdellovibrio sp. HCB185ZH]|uniref:ribonuclease H-like domain-containing protein n=1 Tax=Bdellovibrio sp. HCB185ZH TaxID=3394235 RepID=UPI0039A5DA61